MSLATRVGAVEDHHLTPKEAVICWIREAHQFDSPLEYGRWLLEQPEDASPLVRLPRQVVAACRKRNTGTPDHHLRDEIYQVQKDLLFLYFLHSRVNLRLLHEQEAFALRLTLLGQRLRMLMQQVATVDEERLRRLAAADGPGGRPPASWQKKTKADLELDQAVDSWQAEEDALRADICATQEAANLISRRYLGAEELFFPAQLEFLRTLLEALAGFRDLYRHLLRKRPPRSVEGFLRWLAEGPAPEPGDSEPPDGAHAHENTESLRQAARARAEEHILMARSEALDTLGEHEASARLMEDWMRTREE